MKQIAMNIITFSYDRINDDNNRSRYDENLEIEHATTVQNLEARCIDLERQVEFWKNKCTTNDNINNNNNTGNIKTNNDNKKKRKYKCANTHTTAVVNICNIIDEIEILASELHTEYQCYDDCVNSSISSNVARDAKLAPILFSTILDLLFSQNIVDFLRRSTTMRSKIK
jgi:hypothetical protein